MKQSLPVSGLPVRNAARWALWSAVLLGWASCGARAAEPRFDVQVTDAWIRWLPANLPGAGYMTLTNGGSTEQVLTGATSPDYAQVEFHQTHGSNGMNAMSPVAAISLKPHAVVRFAEGGYHLMLMQPTRPIHPGERILLTLRFAGGQPLVVPFTVRAGAATH
jgi:copper(I)-binding protein